jgi:hypothetical protein
MMNRTGSDDNMYHGDERRSPIDILAQVTVDRNSTDGIGSSVGGATGEGTGGTPSTTRHATADDDSNNSNAKDSGNSLATEDSTTDANKLAGTGITATATPIAVRYATILVTFSYNVWMNSRAVSCLSVCSAALHKAA